MDLGGVSSWPKFINSSPAAGKHDDYTVVLARVSMHDIRAPGNPCRQMYLSKSGEMEKKEFITQVLQAEGARIYSTFSVPEMPSM